MKKMAILFLGIVFMTAMSGIVSATHQESNITFSDYKQFKINLQTDNPDLWNSCQITSGNGYINALAKHNCLQSLYGNRGI